MCEYTFINLTGAAFDKPITEKNHKYLFSSIKDEIYTIGKEHMGLEFLFWWFSVTKLIVKDENLEGRKEKLCSVYRDILGDLPVHTVEGWYPNNLSFLIKNYPLGCHQIHQVSPDIRLYNPGTPKEHTLLGGQAQDGTEIWKLWYQDNSYRK